MTDWTRRALLGAGVAALAGVGLLVWTGRRAAETARADALVAVLRDRNAASRVGERILTEFPAWGDATALRRTLGAALGGGSTVGLAARVAQHVREDFDGGRVVLVDGWVLAETEARLYTLAALSR